MNYASFTNDGGVVTELICENGTIQMWRGRYGSQQLVIRKSGEEEKVLEFSPEALGYHLEAVEVMSCLDQGRIESEVVPLSFTETLIETLDRVRVTAGIRYPGRD